MDSISAILKQRHELALHKKPYPNMQKDLVTLIPKRFLDFTPWDQILEIWHKWASRKPTDPAELAVLREFRWLVEELKVSIFAQELGTKATISPRRMDEFLQKHAALVPR